MHSLHRLPVSVLGACTLAARREAVILWSPPGSGSFGSVCCSLHLSPRLLAGPNPTHQVHIHFFWIWAWMSRMLRIQPRSLDFWVRAAMCELGGHVNSAMERSVGNVPLHGAETLASGVVAVNMTGSAKALLWIQGLSGSGQTAQASIMTKSRL